MQLRHARSISSDGSPKGIRPLPPQTPCRFQWPAEMFDKGLRSFKFHRSNALTVLSAGPIQTGWTTAAARSISLEADDSENIFDWPTLPDPTLDVDLFLAELEREVAKRGSDTILTLLVEPLSPVTGRLIVMTPWNALSRSASEWIFH